MDQLLSETELQQKEYYNQIASTYDKHYGSPWALDYRSQVLHQALKKIDLKNKRVLDACCGGGENSFFFKNQGSSVVGVDISEAQCEHYRKRFPEGEVVCGSVLKTGFPDNSFDIVVTESLHHLHPYVNDGIQEIIRILKPGGHFLLWEPSAGSALDLARKAWYKLDRQYFEDNESSIDVQRITRTYEEQLKPEHESYGGNIAHLFVMSSMHFRIPQWLVRLYAPLFIRLEFWIQMLQTRFTSCWVLALYQKKSK